MFFINHISKCSTLPPSPPILFDQSLMLKKFLESKKASSLHNLSTFSSKIKFKACSFNTVMDLRPGSTPGQVVWLRLRFVDGLLSDIDDCISVTCNNGGTCEDGIHSFTCVCPYGHTGKFCDVVKQIFYFLTLKYEGSNLCFCLFLKHLEVSEQQHLIGDLRDRWIPNTCDVNRCCPEFQCLHVCHNFFRFFFFNFTAVKSGVCKSS